MPYISRADRHLMDIGGVPEKAGELNYVLTNVILHYLGTNANYQRFNDVIGVLACIQHELYRRVIAPYEDLARDKNGDVYGGET
jgi:hypothetical protein